MRTTLGGFRGEFAFLSNFHLCPLTVGGETYSCAEAAFQASKFTDPAFRARFTHLSGPPAKRLGRTRHPSFRADWDQCRLEAMRQVLLAKFAVPELRAALLTTQGVELVEVNHWSDTYWGVCGGRGENWLGRLLMELRASMA